ncbi:DUF411 domain-containing protein [Pseudoalteromonas obscura]|uniref:DUF411 domain-containing protein n=1 Tax=Pseudoalteromonas obscura TaxID=3048491 RepID=A0ABT7EI29_9GAMM|nr:DUF411 domain-containing protein [Pseudoalteromonas sp. P94(2023)]MDK2594697.1 DUF411 domain-containing protein [Pseudoalteromonas sp. P94(2023)]
MYKFKFVALVLCLSVIFGFQSPVSATQSVEHPMLKVYKTPTCGCCTKWLAHLTQFNISHQIYDLPNLSEVKRKLGIQARYQSCHTGVSDNGYVFEGHIPAKFIKQFLSNPIENAIGLSVPAMPLGSPGMEVGKRFNPYQVLILMKDGSSKVFATVTEYEEQF